jgi:hypothetical protein
MLLELGRILVSATLSFVVTDYLREQKLKNGSSPRRELPAPPAAMTANPQIQGNHMSQFDLIGDDSFGGIGADLIGEDALLHALSVSGDDDLIAGLGNTEIVGAAANRKQAVRGALRKIAMRNAGAVVENSLSRRRRYPLGFVPTAIAAGTSSLIPSAPQNLFRPERLVIPSDIAFDLGVVDIKVGNQSQLVQSVEVPAALFSEVAIDTNVTFDTAEVGNQVSVQARNKSGAALEFTAGLIGTIAK